MKISEFKRRFHPLQSARFCLRTGRRVLSEGGVHVDRFRQGSGPLVVFMPNEDRQGAARLRIYNISKSLRSLGWRALILPPRLTLAQRTRLISMAQPDALVMQGVRHHLNRPGYYPGQTILLDMDDADFHLDHLKSAVKRAVREVSVVMAGSTYIADWCLAKGAASSSIVWTGTPVSQAPRPLHANRPPVVAWAQTRPMTYLREAAFVREAMMQLARRRPGTILRLYERGRGDDPAFAESFRVPGLKVEWVKEMPYEDYLASFDDVAVGLAPLCPDNAFSRGKSFGKILAYLDRHVPTIYSDFGEPTRFFSSQTGCLARGVSDWAEQVDRLLADSNRRQWMADAAFDAFQSQLTTDISAKSVSDVLSKAVFSQAVPQVA